MHTWQNGKSSLHLFTHSAIVRTDLTAPRSKASPVRGRVRTPPPASNPSRSWQILPTCLLQRFLSRFSSEPGFFESMFHPCGCGARRSLDGGLRRWSHGARPHSEPGTVAGRFNSGTDRHPGRDCHCQRGQLFHPSGWRRADLHGNEFQPGDRHRRGDRQRGQRHSDRSGQSDAGAAPRPFGCHSTPKCTPARPGTAIPSLFAMERTILPQSVSASCPKA